VSALPESNNEPNSFLSRQIASSQVFFFDTRTPPGPGLQVMGGGLERCRPEYQIDRPDFPWLLLEFVQSGRGKVTLNGVETGLKAGVFFLYGPGVPHRIITDPEKPLVKYFAAFSGGEDVLEELQLTMGMVSQCIKADPIRRVFDTFIDRGTRNSSYSRPICEAALRQLLYMCREDAVQASATETRAFSTYSRVRYYIEQNFTHIQSLEAVATACELDAPYLCRLFSRFHDESPYQYLTRLQMRRAATLLLQGNDAIKQVAAECGFNDPFHFSRVFKSFHRMPPTRFRESLHTKELR
jgi:AraC-like DNA-binding protein